MDTEGLEGLQRTQQVRYASSEAVKPPDDDGIKATPVGIVHKPVQVWPLLFGAGDSQLHVFAGNLPAATLAIFAKLARRSCPLFAVLTRA